MRRRVTRMTSNPRPKVRRPDFRAPVHSETLTPKRTPSRARTREMEWRRPLREHPSLPSSTTRAMMMSKLATIPGSYILQIRTRGIMSGFGGTNRRHTKRITESIEPMLRSANRAATGRAVELSAWLPQNTRRAQLCRAPYGLPALRLEERVRAILHGVRAFSLQPSNKPGQASLSYCRLTHSSHVFTVSSLCGVPARSCVLRLKG